MRSQPSLASLYWERVLYGVLFRAPGPSGLCLDLANGEPWQEVGERDNSEFRPFLLLATSLRGPLGLTVSLDHRSLLLSEKPALYSSLSFSFPTASPPIVPLTPGGPQALGSCTISSDVSTPNSPLCSQSLCHLSAARTDWCQTWQVKQPYVHYVLTKLIYFYCFPTISCCFQIQFFCLRLPLIFCFFLLEIFPGFVASQILFSHIHEDFLIFLWPTPSSFECSHHFLSFLNDIYLVVLCKGVCVLVLFLRQTFSSSTSIFGMILCVSQTLCRMISGHAKWSRISSYSFFLTFIGLMSKYYDIGFYIQTKSKDIEIGFCPDHTLG